MVVVCVVSATVAALALALALQAVSSTAAASVQHEDDVRSLVLRLDRVLDWVVVVVVDEVIWWVLAAHS